MLKGKVHKYGYHKNRNKIRIAFTNEQQRDYQANDRHILDVT